MFSGIEEDEVINLDDEEMREDEVEVVMIETGDSTEKDKVTVRKEVNKREEVSEREEIRKREEISERYYSMTQKLESKKL